jgi:hypothetical protein
MPQAVGKGVVKVSMNLRPEAAKRADELAERASTTRTDIVQRGISVLNYVDEATRKGGTLIVEYKDGTRERVVLPW